MKRALILLPLLAIAGGLILFVTHRGGFGPASPSKTLAPSAEAAAPDHPAPPKAGNPVPSFSGSDLGDLAGAIRFTVTGKQMPLKDAKITVQKSGTPDFMKFKTEADGTQILHGLPPVEYGIRIEHPDFMVFDTDVIVEPGKTTPVTAELKQGGKIYGTVTDKAGLPLAKTKCFLFGGEGGRSMPNTQVETDEKGQYAIKAIPTGNYGIRFRHLKHKPQDRPNLLFRSHTDEYKVDVALELGAQVSGRVVDDEGKPIAGVMIVAGTRGSAGMDTSAKDGTFSVGGLFELPVHVQASKAEYGKVTLRDLPSNGPELEIKLPRAGKISARVVTEEPPRQVLVVLSKFDEAAGGVAMADSKTFPDPPAGAFVMTDIAPGTYWLDVHIEGLEAIERPQVVVAPGQTLDGVVITFKKKS